MKKVLYYVFSTLIVLSLVVMLVSFFFTLPQPLVIADAIVLILAIIAFLVLDRDAKTIAEQAQDQQNPNVDENQNDVE